MVRVELQNPQTATGERKEILSQINSTFGTVPNMFRAIANSTPALRMMWSAFGALGGGSLGAKLGEQIAVAVANLNRCEYCLAAHTSLGKMAGLSSEVMSQAQLGLSSDSKIQVALSFAVKLVKEKANVSQEDIASLKNAGYSEENIAEIIAHVALNIFTNYTNVALDVPVDFPKIELRK